MNPSDGDEMTKPTSIVGDLSARLRALEASGSHPQNGNDRDVSQPRPESIPLPPLTRPAVEAGSRQPTPEGLAVADRILTAARRITTAPELNVARSTNVRPGVSNEHANSLTNGATVVSTSDRSFTLDEGGTLVVGRVPGDGQLAVDHSEVSRRHVLLELRLGQLLATDLGSTNGTTVVSSSGNRDLSPHAATALQVDDRLVVNGDVILCHVRSLAGAQS